MKIVNLLMICTQLKAEHSLYIHTTGPRDSPGEMDGRRSPEPALGDSGSSHLRTPIVMTTTTTNPATNSQY